jgi:LysR family transcriptional activator of nhaA
MGEEDLALMKGLKLLGKTEVKEDIHAIFTRRSRHHPLVAMVVVGAAD